MEEQPDVEILVHIGARSRAIDDARYRSLAAAYLAYQPKEVVYLYSQSHHDSCEQDDSYEPTAQGPPSLAAGDGEYRIMQSDDGIDSTQSLQASFQSVVDNSDSPKIHMREVPKHDFLQQTPTSGIQSSWQTPPSVVQDSHPLNHADFTTFTSPTRVLENYLQYFKSPSSSSKNGSQSSKRVRSNKHISQHDGYPSLRNRVPPTPHMIPCTPQVRNRTELPSDGSQEAELQYNVNSQQQPIALDMSDDNVIEETTFLSSSQRSAQMRAESEPPLKSRKLEPITSPHALVRAASDIGPHPSSNLTASVTVELLSTHGFTYESLEIRSQEPPTSEPYIEPQDLITPSLRNLSRDADSLLCFQPREQTRELRPYERGYWLVDCSSWEPRLKRDAWAFLANYIGTGNAGWGVWCKRDPEFRELRAYCWGSVIPHIYYVLCMSSQRRIGSTWIDAEGLRVIAMGSRDQP
ncbi:hypothetical protein O1611_g2973 [Lasiodiplodia mahajangana]|uniref:Uncharacterized protein n=1 Tax=Lasiodiplodia mahajangana TaxID=1108764 RepID=A0ACC2JT18_9PEZI|nr:hypothetical protein O1611_g2973 [Lasiodiplodia mahajangana]